LDHQSGLSRKLAHVWVDALREERRAFDAGAGRSRFVQSKSAVEDRDECRSLGKRESGIAKAKERMRPPGAPLAVLRDELDAIKASSSTDDTPPTESVDNTGEQSG
jgi:hypothetical protein